MDVYSFQYLFCLVLIHSHVIRYHVLNIFDTFDVFQYVSRCSSSNIDVLLRHSDFGCKKGRDPWLHWSRNPWILRHVGILGLRKHRIAPCLLCSMIATGIARWWLPSMRMIPVRGMFYTAGMFHGCGFTQIYPLVI